jgi:hypothetical protein
MKNPNSIAKAAALEREAHGKKERDDDDDDDDDDDEDALYSHSFYYLSI